MSDRDYPILRGRVVPRGEPLAKFSRKSKLGHYESNGGIPKSRKGLLFLKNAFEIWGNLGKSKKSLSHFCKEFQEMLIIPPF